MFLSVRLGISALYLTVFGALYCASPLRLPHRLSIIIRIEMHRQFKRFIDRRQCRQI